ncbi:unnamed protein product [Closterium sp. Naga37s-1]|nr:unnamed protein product [Closterium sp. Naga37s-1]
MAATAAVGARRATFSSAGRLLPMLVLALLLQAPSASARHWFWNDALFPVAATGETKPAASFTAETEGAAVGTAATPAPVAAPAPAPAPAVSCYDAPVGRYIASGAAPDPCAALAAELKRTAGELGGTTVTGGLGFAAPSLFSACHSTFLFRDGNSTEDVQVPWMGTAGLDLFANATEYWKSYCAVKDPSVTGGTSAHASTVGHADTPMIDRFLERHPAPVYYHDDTSDGSGDDLNVEIASLSAAAAGPTVTRISPTTDNYLVYLVGGSTAVVWIHQFAAKGEVSQALEAKNIDEEQYMIKEVTKALNTAAASNASQIIIDVRGNGGGHTGAVYTALRLLMGAAKVPDSAFALPVDFVVDTQYTEKAVGVLAIDSESLYYVDMFTDLNGTDLSSAFDYAPFRKLRFTEAGPAGNYSAPFKQNLTFTGKQEQPVFGDRPFLVLSDGYCFSACAILTHVLGKRHKVPMVTVGGLPNQPPDVGSSCLGSTNTDIYAMSPSLSKLAAQMPQNASPPLKVKGAVGMAFTNGYVDSEIPCEFEFLPSQHHINYTVDLIDKPWAMWNEVAKLFNSAAAA